jgi:cell wall-associated NlpC family hydrolase
MPLLARTFGSRKLRYRAATVTAGVAALGILAATGGIAMAAPQPTVAQVQKKVTQLGTKIDQLDEQLDQVKQELTSANQRLAVVNREAARYAKQYNSMRTEVGRIAAQAYEQGNINSSVALLTSGHPQQILDQSSILTELSATNRAEMNQFIAASHQLTSTQQAAEHTKAGIAQLKGSLSKRRAALDKQQAQQKTLLAQLTPAQQAVAGSGASPVSTGPTKYTGPTSTQAQKAVAYAYAQLGCPYVYGGTGPCSSGFDCSGLMVEAWASAGVAIPRTSEEQAGLPAVSTSELQPGDILEFAGDSHVGMYVGGGMIIDAPHSGANVEKVALSGWYQSELDGAVRP